MRILVFHGYLLRGTGSNVYTALLATALARQGHEVHLLCQERRPEDVEAVTAAADWDGGRLEVRPLRDPAPGCAPITTYRPNLGGVLPVYVADRYEGVEARPFTELDDAAVAGYVERNVAAVREVAARVAPDVALANHLIMGPLILARALGGDVPYAVKVHGSALEYTVKVDPARFLPAAREGLAGARTVLVGSRHTAESLWAAVGDPELAARTRLGPPGVDVALFRPRAHGEATADLHGLAGELQRRADAAPAAADGAAASAFSRDAGEAARALRAVDAGADRHVAFVGKLIVSKGVDLLAAAWPLVLAAVPDARLLVVGFGAYREPLEALLAALAAGDLDAVRRMAEAGRAAEGGPRAPLRHLLAFLDDLEESADRDVYLGAARALPDRVLLTGRLEHDELAPLLALCEAQVVPSTFPEAFGMVAAEAAACGTLPVVADHSGLAEVRAILAAALPEQVRPWLAFERGPRAVRDLADRLIAWLTAPADLRDATRAALVATARERFAWEGVARDVLAAAEGRHADLPEP
ncbi:MAG TPA: glycosyltransferase family 4 protein [Baekduia sp.]|nr:glycosyltransferase family 4 protein [Baekduia sp.]